MREIKFKAWSKEEKAWIAGFNMVNFHSYYNKGLEPNIYRYDREWKLSEIELCQFTGLHDKNGKEIYEDDIITFNFITKSAKTRFTGKILMDDYMWCIETTEGEIFSINRISQPEVIGNYYEDPELIKALNQNS